MNGGTQGKLLPNNGYPGRRLHYINENNDKAINTLYQHKKTKK